MRWDPGGIRLPPPKFIGQSWLNMVPPVKSSGQNQRTWIWQAAGSNHQVTGNTRVLTNWGNYTTRSPPAKSGARVYKTYEWHFFSKSMWFFLMEERLLYKWLEAQSFNVMCSPCLDSDLKKKKQLSNQIRWYWGIINFIKRNSCTWLCFFFQILIKNACWCIYG